GYARLDVRLPQPDRGSTGPRGTRYDHAHGVMAVRAAPACAARSPPRPLCGIAAALARVRGELLASRSRLRAAGRGHAHGAPRRGRDGGTREAVARAAGAPPAPGR